MKFDLRKKEGLKIHMNRFFGHLRVVTKHKWQVFKNCCRLGMPIRGILHDTSKFSPIEFFNSVKYFSDGKRSPTVGERIKKGYSAAWLHHKGRNKHHFEYWTELNWRGTDLYKCRMPLKYVKEMFCDRVAATKTYLKDKYTQRAPLEYYWAKGDGCFMHENTARMIEKMLLLLAIYGEKEAFALVRKIKKY